jgi:hypothetical protein
VIGLHFLIFGLILISLFECAFNGSLYNYQNRIGLNSPFLILMEILFINLRNTASRVLTLLVALGYGILIRSIERYQMKIIVLTILYTVALGAYNGI